MKCLEKTNLSIGTENGGRSSPIDRHYIYHTAWASRKIKEINPEIHYDFSSYLYFSTIISSFKKVKFFDYRPAKIDLSNFESDSVDLKSISIESNSVKSISCMHVIEHIGLGRYGDELDGKGDIKASLELSRILSVGGDLLIVVPIGKPSLKFNAHRVYSFQMILDMFPHLKLRSWAIIRENDQGGYIENCPIEIFKNDDYSCGCFHFTKEQV
ncbi:PF03269 domain protein [Leptospira yanagawae serovar Saopaulo str. Sao Paulo = ATCC 700523]|uniref:PF03269 domain protein n=1 Tax=Leptospira yanagawae serovar Saopaulo str. Sao Paulo = ATCC 700523 TaxID=1249483 RepID=A0A5E8HCW8_9LEPT|nr:DUF268 domain-containing protein [Leptospira yanagawae]EOQ88400.1 PF03269 domain protein [Leptospira yanagawae serovar Saopaulo str. Sao Paulo = ATCC 700523]